MKLRATWTTWLPAADLSFLRFTIFRIQKMGQGQEIHHVGLMEETTGHAWLHKTLRELALQLANVLREIKAEGLFEVYRDQVGLLPVEVKW